MLQTLLSLRGEEDEEAECPKGTVQPGLGRAHSMTNGSTSSRGITLKNFLKKYSKMYNP